MEQVGIREKEAVSQAVLIKMGASSRALNSPESCFLIPKIEVQALSEVL